MHGCFFDLLAGAGTPGTFSSIEGPLGLPLNSVFSAGPLTAEQFSMENTSYSVFGTVDFEPVDGLIFTAGFNYTDDSKDFALAQQSFDELSNINLVDTFITRFLTAGTVTTRDQFQALPAANQQALIAAATNPAMQPFSRAWPVAVPAAVPDDPEFG